MKHKFIKTACLTFGLLLGGGALASCSFIGKQPFSISEVTTRDLENGDVEVTIRFTDEKEPVVKFTVKKGDTGLAGTGIDHVTSDVVDTDSGKKIIIRIFYTDDKLSPTIIETPVNDGKDGVSIKEMAVQQLENGDQRVTITYSDPTKAPFTFDIPKGEKGDGIANITASEPDELGYTTITIKLTNEEEFTFKIPAGAKGIGVDSIKANTEFETETEYCLEITYSDGYVDYIYFAKPQTSEWLSGNNTPTDDMGKDGDFFFNMTNGEIHKKEEGTWIYIFKYKGDPAGSEDKKVEVDIELDLNGGTFVKDKTSRFYTVFEGECLKTIPLAQKPGCEFLGWYTDKELTAVSGKLTKLTTIGRNPNTVDGSWTFYAQYQPL